VRNKSNKNIPSQARANWKKKITAVLKEVREETIFTKTLKEEIPL
jgi:hypothetical protein